MKIEAPTKVYKLTVNMCLIVSLLLIMAANALQANAETPMQIPADGVIDRPGEYLLSADLIVDRDFGLKVQADDVKIDLGGHALRYSGQPEPGIFGVISSGASNLKIINGSVGGFWFGLQCVNIESLVVERIAFDDIPYLAANIAQSKGVAVRECLFTNFRYDISKDKDTYVIGINIGAEDAVISGNTFRATYTGNDPHAVGMETVFVLFSANVSNRCTVTLNDMAANTVLPRSYGVWVASNASITASYNTIRNMKYGICLASDAAAVTNENEFTADSSTPGATPIETIGVSAGKPKEIHMINNRYTGLSIEALLPENTAMVE